MILISILCDFLKQRYAKISNSHSKVTPLCLPRRLLAGLAQMENRGSVLDDFFHIDFSSCLVLFKIDRFYFENFFQYFVFSQLGF